MNSAGQSFKSSATLVVMGVKPILFHDIDDVAKLS
jgi:hypothetical protein